MESNKLHQDNVKLTTQLAKASTEEEEEEDEEDIPNEEDTVNQSAQSSDESEEFFDIGNSLKKRHFYFKSNVQLLQFNKIR